MADPDEWWLLSHERRATIQGWLDPNARTHAQSPGQQALFTPPPEPAAATNMRRASSRRTRKRKEST